MTFSRSLEERNSLIFAMVRTWKKLPLTWLNNVCFGFSDRKPLVASLLLQTINSSFTNLYLVDIISTKNLYCLTLNGPCKLSCKQVEVMFTFSVSDHSTTLCVCPRGLLNVLIAFPFTLNICKYPFFEIFSILRCLTLRMDSTKACS